MYIFILPKSNPQGHGDVGAYGHPTSKTPNLDRFAREGQKLYQYYSAANICSPSRGAILTGRHYARLGVYPGVFSPNSKSGLPLKERYTVDADEWILVRADDC